MNFKKQPRKNYSAMFGELKYLVSPSKEKLGSIVYIKNGITADEYKDKLRNKYDYHISESQANKLLSYYTMLKEYEKDLLENLTSYRLYIYSFIRSESLDIASFCHDADITVENFENAISVIGIFDYDLYQEFFIELERKTKLNLQNKISDGHKVINALNETIELENGKTRDFDILDYYLITKTKPIDVFYAMRKRVSYNELFNLKVFANKHRDDYVLSYQNIMELFDTRVEFGCERDEVGRAIPGTGKEITEDDKIALLDYLRSNSIPITHDTYYYGLIRIKKGVFGVKTLEQKQNNITTKIKVFA